MKKQYKVAILSILFWGSGQFLFGKQKVKGILFFLAQLVFFGIELITGYWFNFIAGQISNFSIRLYGGFFTKGIWGLITLGSAEGIKGDHSTILLINGIIAGIGILIFMFLFIWNIIDGYKIGVLLNKQDVASSLRKNKLTSRKKVFPYMVLLPTLVIITLIIVMPIIFSVLTAFTNYDANHLPPAHLVNWVVLDNFIKLIRIPIWSKTFIKVLMWTIVWAITATFSAYFFGLLQAILLNSRYVKHKKLFQTIYILPWAIPGMISLLVFRNLLNGQFGPINQFLLDQRMYSMAAGAIPYNVWLVKGYLDGIPIEIDEAAYIDGSTYIKTFTKIVLPLSRSIITYCAVSQFMMPWMDYILPNMLLSSDENKTLAVGLFSMISGKENSNFTMFAAGAVLIALPITILFLFFQKYLVQGIAAGANKG